MKAGDQFLSVERLPLASATHKEAVALISSRKKVNTYIFEEKINSKLIFREITMRLRTKCFCACAM